MGSFAHVGMLMVVIDRAGISRLALGCARGVEHWRH